MTGRGARRQAAPLRWFREAALGARMSVSGGRDSWARLGLIAVAVGAAVALLLAAASVPTLLDARKQRDEARSYDMAAPRITEPSAETLLIAYATTEYADHRIYGQIVEPEGPRPPRPPGVAELPGPGEMVVSPALARLLDSPEHRLLRERLDYRVVGTIGDAGLLGPHEFAYYAGADDGVLSTDMRAALVTRIDDFSRPRADSAADPAILLLLVLATVVALLPLGVFVAAALRFGADQRDRRLAALRLIGADRWAAARTACGETLVGALAGLAVGVGLFVPLRQAVPPLRPGGIDVFAADIVPHPLLAAVVSVGVVGLAVAVTLVSTARAAADPLGVTRRASRPRRRLWWRAAPLAVGAALLAPAATGSEGFGSGSVQLLTVSGMVLFLLGAAAVTPWLFQMMVSRARRGGVARLLAVRRLRADGVAETRIVAGVVVAVAGVIALQTVFAGVEQDLADPRPMTPGEPLYSAKIPDRSPAAAAEAAAQLGALPQVRDVRAVTEYLTATAPAGEVPVRVGDCAALREHARVGACSDGDVFVVDGGARAAAGDRLRISGLGAEVSWTLPAATRTVPPPEPDDAAEGAGVSAPAGSGGGVLATPGAVSGAGLPPTAVHLAFDLKPATQESLDEVRTALRGISPLAHTKVNRMPGGAEVIDPIRGVLTAVVSASLAVIGLGLLISTVEQLRESRRPLAVLAASGVRKRTLAVSVLYQAAIPLATGLLVAVAVGATLAGLLLRVLDYPVEFDPAAIAAIAAVAAAVVLGIVLLSLPVLTRLVRPDNLRAE
ncbi:FtsX-like permease family protein [Streptomonospora arabica]|uniref:FtsX-like permease family protein n=1 Tax=Streptomonospora arabica TaxID=412417 RepID=A0ABV9SGK4_9ACTN